MPLIRFVLIVILFLNAQFLSSQNDTIAVDKIKILTDSAIQYINQAEYQKSLLASRAALNLSLKNKNVVHISKCYNIIAANYHLLSQFNKAIFYYNKAYSLVENTNELSLKYKIKNNLGNIYFFEKKDYSKGIQNHKEALNFAKVLKDEKSIFLTNINVAWAYFEIGNFKLGNKHLQTVNKNYKKLITPTTSTAFYLINGMNSSYKNEKKLAKQYFLKAITEGKKWQKDSDLSFVYLEYSNFLNKIRDHKQAYKYLLLHNALTQELNDTEIFDKAEIVGNNLELEEYRREIDKISNEKNAQDQLLHKSKIISFLFVSISFILLVFIASLFRNVYSKKILNAKLVQANEDLKIAKEQAEEASRLKTQFISTISHEVRTPLYGIIGITNMITEEHPDLVASKHLSSLKFSARYLLSLVNDILHINKIEENKLTLEIATFNITDEIQLIVNSLTFLAKKHNNVISVNIDPSIPEFLIGDKLRLSQILMNLINNALKFTQDGSVIVSTNLIKAIETKYFIEFTIKDTGIGIATQDQNKVFEKFVQLERKETDYQGTGLGLAIVKRLLKLFNSEIVLTSKIGEGSSFSFIIPFEYDLKKTTQIINNFEVDLKNGETITILVVEDNSINQLVTKKIIEKNDCKCKIVSDGLSAINILKKEKFDVILMDINMPIINGFETTKRIRGMKITTPIIALTAFDKEEIIEEALASGMNDVIIKPFDSVHFFKIINFHYYNNKT